MFFSPKKTRIYKLHMKSRSQKKKKKSTPLRKLLSKRVFQFGKDRAFYRAEMKLKKLYLLHQLNWCRKQTTPCTSTTMV